MSNFEVFCEDQYRATLRVFLADNYGVHLGEDTINRLISPFPKDIGEVRDILVRKTEASEDMARGAELFLIERTGWGI